MRPGADPDSLISLVGQIDAWLPQIQCARCGYPGCHPYAEAIARGETGINRCPPGGKVTIRALANLLGTPELPLDPAIPAATNRVLARVIERDCIGCTLCLRACPVDAIIGARRHMHSVLEQGCTGCGLCAPHCPTSCIELIPHPSPASGPWPNYSLEESTQASHAWRKRQERLARKTNPRNSPEDSGQASDRDSIRAEIQAAVERVRSRRQRPIVPLQLSTRSVK